ncbi:5'-3' exoribonuclease 2 [Linnemannia gamsii]|uniref:5'-3' exoribonuclease 2 n=1 Tax=Linnemannia gamsii TaxID=64522 RepID=A0ABQ7KHX8_9FUNG|nr:5'-3' exoribonuclease 2 [Linnemannia gamsii]
MGVPALFRWLANKYPKITTNVVEEQPKEINGVVVPIDITQPNPNNEENDYLYLDMNNIIHPCCKPEGKPPPANEEEMMVAIFAYIERIVNMVRPRKLLYMAVDGVAPRAKMNQQRSRRFRTAQEAKEKAASEEAAWEELTAELKAQRPDHDKEQKFDSNCITPGTPFMVNLGKTLRFWVAKKLNEDPGWMNMKVILSDGSVPGEGEHKMMNFIRSQRSAPHHNPNTSHVIYGLDADLIMLALGTHEPYFKVLREDVFFQEGSSKNKCFLCNQTGHMAAQCQGKAKVKSGDFDEKAPPVTEKPYIYLNVSILREYLEVELKVDNLPFEWDIEQAIDDWVFLCFFVGNDFLPHLPSLETREGAIDVLIEIWKQVLPLMGGYMTHNGDVNLKRAQFLMTELGKKEDGIFQERREKEERRAKNNKRRKVEDEARAMYASQQGGAALSQNKVWEMPAVAVKGLSNKAEAEKEVAALNKKIMEEKVQRRTITNHAAAVMLKADLAKNDELTEVAETTSAADAANVPKEEATEDEKKELENTDETMESESTEEKKEPESAEEKPAEETAASLDTEMTETNPRKRSIAEVEENEDEASNEEEDDTEAAATPTPIPTAIAKKKAVNNDEEPEDNVRLWEPEYKERYYRNKFHIELSDTEARRAIVKSYIEGCCWVMKYYMQGCPSWQWYYPYHFSPFASDFVDIGDIEVKFEVGQPFHPIEQLMGVLPAASKQHIPPVFHPLMCEEESPIIDFYPEDFEMDLNGKKFAWQGVALLPFMDPKRLLDAMAPLYPKLTEDEVERNKFGQEVLFVSEKSKLYDPLCDKLYSSRSEGEEYDLEYKKSGRLLGLAKRDPTCIPRSSFPSPLVDYGLEDIPVDKSISVIFSNPKMPAEYIHPSLMLKGVNFPKRVLSGDDIQWIRNGGGAQRGGRGGRGGFRGGRGGYNHRGQSNGQYGGGFDRNARGGSSSFRGRGGFTADNRGASDRTYPGQSYDRSYNSSQGGQGGGYGGYNGGSSHDGSRFPRQDPYQGYDSRPGHVGYGGGRGGRGGYGDSGHRGSSHGSRGGHGGYSGGHQGQGYGSQGGYDNGHSGGYSSRGNDRGPHPYNNQGGSSRGGYGGHRGNHQGGYQGSQQGGYQGGQQGDYNMNGGGGYGSGGRGGGYGGGGRGGYNNNNNNGGSGRFPPQQQQQGYPQQQAPVIPGFAPVNNYGPPAPAYGAPAGGYGGALPPGILPGHGAPAAQAPTQGWYGHSNSGNPPAHRGGRGGFNNNLPPFPYPRQ